MLLNGPDMKNHESQQTLTISQTIMFNCKKKTQAGTKPRHMLSSEPPLPLYVGLSVRTVTRSKKLIEQLHHLGLSVSYNRILQLENQLATAACQKS